MAYYYQVSSSNWKSADGNIINLVNEYKILKTSYDLHRIAMATSPDTVNLSYCI